MHRPHWHRRFRLPPIYLPMPPIWTETRLEAFESMVRRFDFNGGGFDEYEMQRIEQAYSDLSSYGQMRAEVFLRDYPDVHYYLFDF